MDVTSLDPDAMEAASHTYESEPIAIRLLFTYLDCVNSNKAFESTSVLDDKCPAVLRAVLAVFRRRVARRIKGVSDCHGDRFTEPCIDDDVSRILINSQIADHCRT